MVGLRRSKLDTISETKLGHKTLALGEVAAREKWRIRELHTEEGRLDEVFRSITLPDSDAKEARK